MNEQDKINTGGHFGRLMARAIVFCAVGLSAALAGEKWNLYRERPFVGAYVHIPTLFNAKASLADCKKAISDHLDRFKTAGLRVVMPYVTDTSGATAYPSKIVKVHSFPGWDPVADIVEEAAKQQLVVWPVVCVISSGHEKPGGILVEHPDWALRDKDGRPMGYISPYHPQARKWIISVLKEIVSRYEPEGILLDYLRYPSGASQLDVDAQRQFEQACDAAGVKGEEARKKRFQRFKEQGLTDLVRMISQELRKLKSDLMIGIYTWGPQVTRSHAVAQAWPVWVKRGYIDMVSVSGYCYEKNYGKDYLKVFEDRMRDAVEILKPDGLDNRLTLTLGVKTSHGQIARAEEVGQYLRLAERAGIRGVAVFTWTYLQPFLDEVNKAGYLRTISRATSQAGG